MSTWTSAWKVVLSVSKAENPEKQANLTCFLYFLTSKSDKWPATREVLVGTESEGQDVVHTASKNVLFIHIRGCS